ncbi:arylesterase [Cellvibrio zantedeschiae]|uniref:Arylesterase n=1 Tax=Cellvibrio zantedeschiae TaxID=1237077 RepID=A0ABQ3B352_9GAMM|nr:arylesterase [Cellvibrio zantedeschiae]GGY73224.1 arylesterase [Cellvibrio zantedeschiae]
MTFVRILVLALFTFVATFAFAKQPSILVMGDSLSAGYGIKLEQGWVHLLQQELAKKQQATLINASVSGETTSGGLTRLPALLSKHKPDIVILELGGNDGLRGQPLKIMRENLQAMISLSQGSNAKVLLAGMQIPPNYGQRYTTQFKDIYPELAEKNKILLIPFLLEDVAGHSNLIQPDNIHPTAEAQPAIVKNVLPVLLPMIKEAAQ